MADAFFNYFRKERDTVSRELLGPQTGVVKAYSHVPTVILPEPGDIDVPLGTVLHERKSTREFGETAVSSFDLSTLLYWGIGKAGRPDVRSRSYPSGGFKYPIEGYAIVFAGGDVPPGVYHYHVQDHVLEQLREGDFLPTLNEQNFFQTAAGIPVGESEGAASVLLVFTFIKSRSMQMYGGLAYKLGLLDTGHVSQNIYLLSSALGLGCCAFGGCDTPELEELLGIDGENENIVLGCMVGNKKDKSV